MQNVRRPTIAGVMWKTVSESCNLACDYCYYSRCQGKPGKVNHINLQLLEKFIIEYMSIKKRFMPFIWQGGEPMLAGLKFFKEVVRLQLKHAPKNTVISNTIQTNGTLITKDWANFLRKYNFLVGVSIDGPKEINDRRRVNSNGSGSFDSIMKGIGNLKEAGVDFNILTVIHEDNVHEAGRLMEFYKEQNFSHVQFIPCMDFRAQDVKAAPKYHITPKQYGDFLCQFFDFWYNGGNPEVSVRFFDNILANYLHQSSEMCTFSQTCPTTLVFENNGNAYPCDFLIHDKYKLGNIENDSLESILNNPIMDEFLSIKPNMPLKCQSCEFLNLCHGGCPRNRTGDSYQNPEYFCESYQKIFRYANERMKIVEKNIKTININRLTKEGYPLPKRNERCLCGSGKKFKNCCSDLVTH